MKKPKLSEIRALIKEAQAEGIRSGIFKLKETGFILQHGVPYLLDLVKRLGEEIKKAPDPARGTCLSEYCDWYNEARALLEEIKL